MGIFFRDPLGLLDPLPGAIESLYLERECPPRLSLPKRMYYHLRPFIPLRLRHLLQSSRHIVVSPKWYLAGAMVEEYSQHVGTTEFVRFRKTLWPDGKTSPLVLTHDIESLSGMRFVPKVLDLEMKYGVKSSWNVVPYLYPIDEGIIRLIRGAGCEVGIHGYNHDGRLFLSRRIFDERKTHINEAMRRFDASGFRSPATLRNLEWLQELDIDYDASCFDVDPFQPMPGGTFSIWPFQVGRFIELPYTLPQDHVLWIQLGESDNDIWEKKTIWLRENNGMILLITHPDYLMMDENIKMYEDLLRFFVSFNDLWNVLPKDLVHYWRRCHEYPSPDLSVAL